MLLCQSMSRRVVWATSLGSMCAGYSFEINQICYNDQFKYDQLLREAKANSCLSGSNISVSKFSNPPSDSFFQKNVVSELSSSKV